MSDSPVRLELAAHRRYLRVARAAASSLGAASGFQVEEIDDLRIAVDELCTALLELGDSSEITLELADQDGVVVVHGSVPAGEHHPHWSDERFDLARQILRVVATEYVIDERDNKIHFVLRQHRRV